MPKWTEEQKQAARTKRNARADAVIQDIEDGFAACQTRDDLIVVMRKLRNYSISKYRPEREAAENILFDKPSDHVQDIILRTSTVATASPELLAAIAIVEGAGLEIEDNVLMESIRCIICLHSAIDTEWCRAFDDANRR